MIQAMMFLFSLLLGLLTWFLLTKSSEIALVFDKKSVEKTLRFNGKIYFSFTILSFFSVLLNSQLIYAVILTIISIYTAFFSIRLASSLKK